MALAPPLSGARALGQTLRRAHQTARRPRRDELPRADVPGLANELLRSVARIANAPYCFCILIDGSRLEIGPRHGIAAYRALDVMLGTAPTAVESALVYRRAAFDGVGALCLPLDLGPGQRGALYIGRHGEAPAPPALERELLQALAEQIACTLSAGRAQRLLARLRADLGRQPAP